MILGKMSLSYAKLEQPAHERCLSIYPSLRPKMPWSHHSMLPLLFSDEQRIRHCDSTTLT